MLIAPASASMLEALPPEVLHCVMDQLVPHGAYQGMVYATRMQKTDRILELCIEQSKSRISLSKPATMTSLKSTKGTSKGSMTSLTQTFLKVEQVDKGVTELALSELQDGPDAHHGPVAHYYWKPPIRSTAPGPSAQGVFPQLGISVHDNHSMGLLLPGAIAGVADEWLGTTKRMLLLGERYCCLLRLLLLLPLCWCPVAAAALLVLRLLLALQALPLLQPLPAAFYSTENPAAAFVTLSMPTGMTNHHHVDIHNDALLQYHPSADQKYVTLHIGMHEPSCAIAQHY